MKRTLLLSLLAVAIVACREKHITSGNDSGSSSGAVVVTEPTGPDNSGSGADVPAVDSTQLDRLVVSFISKGAGIDYAAQANLDKWLSKHADVKCSKVSWGREGEVDYVFDLKTRDAAAQKDVVKEVRTLIGANQNVLIQEWTKAHSGYVVAEAPVEPVAASTPLVVSFISKGEGIDLVTKEKFDEWLSKRADFPYFVTQKGREGEMKYCFMMTGKNSAQQAAFTNDVKAYLAGKELIFIDENAVCEHVHVPHDTEVAPEAVVADTNVARLVVSFISKGEGIDNTTKEEFEKWLAMREKFVYETTIWGREGEVNFCFRMTNVSTREQDIFIKDVRTFMTDKELVLVSEYAKCDKRK